MPAFERIEGVASVSASGLIEKQLEIVLDKERIEDLNSQVKAEVEKKLMKTARNWRMPRRRLPRGAMH